MKILVLSDSHGGMGFMRRYVRVVKPDAMIHLGDYYEDAQNLAEEFPHIPLHQVPGNCDRYRMVRAVPEILCYKVCGVSLYMTHGHKHNVKMELWSLLRDARKAGVQAVLYGHTHIADCHREDDGLWVLNPGAGGSYGGSCGVIEAQDGEILSCRVLTAWDLEEKA